MRKLCFYRKRANFLFSYSSFWLSPFLCFSRFNVQLIYCLLLGQSPFCRNRTQFWVILPLNAIFTLCLCMFAWNYPSASPSHEYHGLSQIYFGPWQVCDRSFRRVYRISAMTRRRSTLSHSCFTMDHGITTLGFQRRFLLVLAFCCWQKVNLPEMRALGLSFWD